MSDLQQFFHMGGYAAFVWTSFGFTFVVLLAHALYSRQQLAKQKQRVIKLAATRKST